MLFLNAASPSTAAYPTSALDPIAPRYALISRAAALTNAASQEMFRRVKDWQLTRGIRVGCDVDDLVSDVVAEDVVVLPSVVLCQTPCEASDG